MSKQILLKLFCAISLIWTIPPSPPLPAAEADNWGRVEKQFRELPKEARELTGPLYWLHGDESKELLEKELDKVAEGGNGSFTAESRPHSDWLGEGWWRDLDICLQKAKKLDLKMWIFDEKWWPSGEVGGKVPPQYGCKKLEAKGVPVEGPQAFSAPGYGGKQTVAVLAGRENGDGRIDGASLVDLTSKIQDGVLKWDVPAGKWQILNFTWNYTGGSRILVDGASRDAVDWYIQTVYQPHYDRFQADFGKTIVGYFYDEPETPSDWGTEVIPLLKERGVDWKKALVAWKFKLAGEEQTAARYQYQDALAEAWGRTFYGGLTQWCEAKGVQSIGHFLEHNLEYLNPNLCAGNMFQLEKYSSMGGIDAVFAQFVMGKRDGSDPATWQTPKLGSSISHAYGKKNDVAMVEIFGARGQDLTYPEMKWWTDHMHVSGINFHIPHSFNPRGPFDTDCPPYFYNGGYEPRWPLYRVYADYTSRLSALFTGGRHVAPVAFLFLGNSAHAGKYIPPEPMTDALQDSLLDCDWIPYDVFEKDMKIGEKKLALREERYRVLVVPPVETIPCATLEKVKQFYDQGGVVVGYGFLPTQSATLGKTASDIARLREAVWGDPKPGLTACKTNAAGGRSYLMPEKPSAQDVWQVVAQDAGVRPTLEVLQGETSNWLHALHRVKEGRDLFLIVNQNHQGAARAFRFRFTAQGFPEIWDALRNEITSVPFERKGDSVELDLTLEPLESAVIVFQPEKRPLPARIVTGTTLGPKRIELTREVAPKSAPLPDLKQKPAPLADCAWVWYPDENPGANAPAGVRYFRKTLTIPAGTAVKNASLALTADNEIDVFVNGRKVEIGAERVAWQAVKNLNVAEFLKPGENLLAVAATNATDKPSPAGLIGKLTVEFDKGNPLIVKIDESWKTHNQKAPEWQTAKCDDTAWVTARKVADYGGGPWGQVGQGVGGLTLSPIKEATPWAGSGELPADVDLKTTRVVLEMEGLAPEEAARVSVNGEYAGGFIGKPLQLDVTDHVKAGKNTFLIEPFAPGKVWLAVYPR
jgi:hypothetical protein